jgi:presenilin-like A22 family membrane protease
MFESMKSKAQTFAGIGGLMGVALASIAAMRMYDFSITDQMQQGLGYILGGLMIGAIAGYLIGRVTK